MKCLHCGVDIMQQPDMFGHGATWMHVVLGFEDTDVYMFCRITSATPTS